jgi:hypothetical protein
MKKFIKTPTATALLAVLTKGMSTRQLAQEHLGRTGSQKI